MGNLDKALELYLKNLEISEKKLGRDSIFVAQTISNIGKIY
jgi:hypothetical protein